MISRRAADMWDRRFRLSVRPKGSHIFPLLLLLAVPAQARLTRFVNEGGTVSGLTPIETIHGHFYGELDPKDPHNAVITDILLAPRNARGMVEYSATFQIVKPMDMSKSNGVLYYTVPNRGNGTLQAFPDGRVSVMSGWQGDLLPDPKRQTIAVPVGKNADGSPITGPVIERLIDISGPTAALKSLTYQRPLTLDSSQAQLLRTGKPVPAADWAFADCTTTPFPGTPDPSKLCVRRGFDPASEYVVVYTAKDPLVLGIGFAATRDLNSFLRYAEKDDTGNPNPVAGKIRWAVSQGSSQSGVFIRSFINLGFNQDEANRIVWDGVNPHIAARQMALNFRFASAGGNAHMFEFGSEGVVWWSDYEDKLRHLPKAGLLDRCRATNTCPKILETFGSTEFYFLRESPNLVGTDAKADIPLPDNVRRYYFPGTTHGGGRGGFSAVAPNPPNGCLLPANPNPERDTLRALDLALIAWVTQGKEPPPSRYPTVARGELVPPKADTPYNPLAIGDFGAGFIYKDLSGIITKMPPPVRGEVPMLFPKVDADGNEIGGVPSVLLSAPLGTYTGWNITAAGVDKGKNCGLNGSFKPFPRATLEARYGTHQGYVDAVKKAAVQAVREGFLLQEDADRMVAQAAAGDVLNQ
jgi:hypothetical protein